GLGVTIERRQTDEIANSRWLRKPLQIALVHRHRILCIHHAGPWHHGLSHHNEAAAWLLRVYSKWPRCHATKEGDELAPPHSITSSARARTVDGTVRPIARAVARLITSSNLFGCSTGISPGFVPRRILSTMSAACRNRWA